MMSVNALAADQTQIGAGNARAEQIGRESPLVQLAKRFLVENARKIEDRKLRETTLDAFNNPKTCGHHILSVAESMARGLSPAFVITRTSAHSAPTLGNEFKVVNWLRAAAIVARLDPVANGYPVQDAQGKYRLPPLLNLGEGVDLPAAGQSNLLIEYQIHNLSDADFSNSIPAVTQSQVFLAQLAPQYGYDAANVTVFNNEIRNVVLAFLSPERLEILYTNGGLEAVKREVDTLKRLRII